MKTVRILQPVPREERRQMETQDDDVMLWNMYVRSSCMSPTDIPQPCALLYHLTHHTWYSPRGYVQLKPFTFQPIQFVLKEKYKQWGDADGLNEAQNPIEMRSAFPLGRFPKS